MNTTTSFCTGTKWINSLPPSPDSEDEHPPLQGLSDLVLRQIESLQLDKLPQMVMDASENLVADKVDDAKEKVAEVVEDIKEDVVEKVEEATAEAKEIAEHAAEETISYCCFRFRNPNQKSQ